MLRATLFLAAAASATLLVVRSASSQAQEWRPPSREMPAMPRMTELRGDWLGPRAAWFRGVESVSGTAPSSLRAAGEPRSGSEQAQMVRFTDGPLPVVVWSDRNGDGRADMVEILRSGGVVVQLVDADFDGAANALRMYDGSGKLIRQDTL